MDYRYSPKVVDADSEYFVTGTIKKIAASKASENFYIKPFWVTTDGVNVSYINCVQNGDVTSSATVGAGTIIGYINTELDFWTPKNPDGAWVATEETFE